MLAYLLAIAVGLGSFSLYMAAFFFPEVHRRYDLIWSGVGLFYALVLWVCAGRITGGLLLGQMASVSLLGWFGWQTLKLRRVQTPVDQQTQLPPSATSTSQVVQATVDQLRANFQQSAVRSPLAARMDQLLGAAEETWIKLGHWINTSVETDSSANMPTVTPSQSINTPLASREHSTAAPQPQSKESQTQTESQIKAESQIKPELTTKPNEPFAEWSDLEAEAHPDMETIDVTTLEALEAMKATRPDEA